MNSGRPSLPSYYTARLVAFVLDMVIGGFIFFVPVSFLVSALAIWSSSRHEMLFVVVKNLENSLMFLLVPLYFAILEPMMGGRTPGRHFPNAKTRVEDIRGVAPGFVRSFVRAGIFMVTLALCGIPLLLTLFFKDKTLTIWDALTGTRVVSLNDKDAADPSISISAP